MPRDDHKLNHPTGHPAAPFRALAPLPDEAAELAGRTAYVHSREALERRSITRGLILLALIVLAASIARAGLARTFLPGWWHQW